MTVDPRSAALLVDSRRAPVIFVCFRPEDSVAAANHLIERLGTHFGAGNVFAGRTGWLALTSRVNEGARGVVVALFGPRWLPLAVAHRRETLVSEDTVISQIAYAMRSDRDVGFVPVVVGGAVMPHRHELPPVIGGLADWPVLSLTDLTLDHDLAVLVGHVDAVAYEEFEDESAHEPVRDREWADEPARAPESAVERKHAPERGFEWADERAFEPVRGASPWDLAAAAAAAGTPSMRDAVDCTVFAPPSARPGTTILVQVFLHTPGQTAQAAALASEFDSATARRGFRGLELPISRGTALQIELTLTGGRVDDPVQRLTWTGRAEAAQFVATVASDEPPSALIGVVVVRSEGVPIGRVAFQVSITESVDVGDPVAHTDRQHRFQRAFASYASPDRSEVLKRVQVLRTAGIETFQDVLDLEPGERWERELYRHIDRSDLFLLFWSGAAKGSEWVRREVDYALSRQQARLDAEPDIRPVVIEGPPVELPWPDLAHLNFFDPIVYLF